MLRFVRRFWPATRGQVLLIVALLFVILVMAVAVLIFAQRADQDRLDDLASVPHVITSSLPIAANAQANDRSVLTLICVENKSLRLVLRTKLAVGETFHTAGDEDRAVIFVGDVKNRIETKMLLVKRALYDTLVSAPLSRTAMSVLGSFFGGEAPEKVSVVTLETDTKLTGQSAKGQIAAFAAGCR